MLCIETSTFLGSLQKFEGADGEFKGALGSRHSLISSPEISPEGTIFFCFLMEETSFFHL